MSDLIGIVLFFSVFSLYGMWHALTAITVWEGISLLLEYKKRGEIAPWKAVFFVLTGVSIALSYWGENPVFFQIKTSLIYISLAVAMLLYKKIQRRSMIELLCSWSQIVVSSEALSFEKYIIGYLVGAGLLNAYVAINCSMSIWFYTKMSIVIGWIILIASMLSKSNAQKKQ